MTRISLAVLILMAIGGGSIAQSLDTLELTERSVTISISKEANVGDLNEKGRLIVTPRLLQLVDSYEANPEKLSPYEKDLVTKYERQYPKEVRKKIRQYMKRELDK